MKCPFPSPLGHLAVVIEPRDLWFAVSENSFRYTILYCVVEEASKGLDRTSTLVKDGLVLQSPPHVIIK